MHVVYLLMACVEGLLLKKKIAIQKLSENFLSLKKKH